MNEISNGGSPSGKRTKVVATLGPATATLIKIRQLAMAGVDVFRLNFSHGERQEHLQLIEAIRRICVEFHRPFAILGDLSGPKLRLGDIRGDAVAVQAGDVVCFTSGAADGSGKRFAVNIADFHHFVKRGEKLLVDDGLIQFEVEELRDADVLCRALNAGAIRSRKGLNLPQTRLPIPALTEKDKDDIRFAVANKLDALALSFVRSPEDISQAKYEIRAAGGEIPVIAKIEKAEAVSKFVQILAQADGAMVARGDLGIEIPMEKVPAIQKRIIEICNLESKPVITATQMLDSMIRHPRATRAEVTDVFNAIQDGTDAIMLSGETAMGQYPVEAVEVMERIAVQAEKSLSPKCRVDLGFTSESVPDVTEAVCRAAVHIAESLGLDCIICPTWSGYTSRHISKFRPKVPIFACSPHDSAVNSLCFSWGVHSRIMDAIHADDMQRSQAETLIEAAVRCARSHNYVQPGMKVLVLGGLPIGVARDTNFLRIVEV